MTKCGIYGVNNPQIRSVQPAANGAQIKQPPLSTPTPWNIGVMPTRYRPKQVADSVGISVTTLYNYGRELAEFLSGGANPPKGQTRTYTPQDMKVIAFASQMLREENATYHEVRQALAGVDLKDFTWSVPEEEPPTEPAAEAETQLVPASLVAAYRTMLEEVKQREQDSQQKIEELQQEINMLQREIGTIQGQLLETRRPWWKRLLGIE